jgi:hypothetical protein
MTMTSFSHRITNQVYPSGAPRAEFFREHRVRVGLVELNRATWRAMGILALGGMCL